MGQFFCARISPDLSTLKRRSNVLKKVRDILDLISTLGFSRETVFQVMNKLETPTFEESFALLILMNYYFYQDSYISLVIEEFYSTYRERINKRYPHEDYAKRMYLIRTNAAILASNLKNETDLEMVTKAAIRPLFD